MEYHCGDGHYIATSTGTIDRCPVAICKRPYELLAVGERSQAENRRLKANRIERENQHRERLFG